MIPVLETSLKYRDECPKCGANWIALADMLGDSLDSDNRATALATIQGCPYGICQIHFKRFLDGY